MDTSRRPYFYAISLLIGVFAITPISGLSLSRVNVPTNAALLGTFALCVSVWGGVVLWNQDYERGLFISVVILSTFGAFVPLSSSGGGIPITPRIYAFDPPLVILGIIAFLTTTRKHLTRGHLLLGLYCIWTLLLVGLAPGPQHQTMVWYAIHSLRALCIFLIASRAVTTGLITARTALGILTITVVGHSVVASAQFITGPIKPLNVLGVNIRSIATISLGPLGTYATGPYISGFTGGAPIVSQILLVLPLILALGLSTALPFRVALGVVTWLGVLIQLTAWDAARGALLVSLALSTLLFGWWKTDQLWQRGRMTQTPLANSSVVRNWWPLVTVLAVLAAIAQAAQFNSSRVTEPTYLNPSTGQSAVSAVDIPGFSTRNLGVRLHQYVGGLDSFLKYPLTGIGGAQFEFISSKYVPIPNMIHNMYIGILAETGIVGALLFFGALVYAVRCIWEVARTRDDPVFIGVLAGIGGFLSLQVFQPQYLFPATMLPFWAVMGIGVGAYRGEREAPTDAWAVSWKQSLCNRSLGDSRSVYALVNVLPLLQKALRRSRFGRAMYNACRSLRLDIGDSHGQHLVRRAWATSGLRDSTNYIGRTVAHSRVVQFLYGGSSNSER